MGGLQGVRHWPRRSITLGDQAFSSLSNVLAVVLVARVLTESEFGVFSLGYAVMIAALGVSRAWFGTRLSLITDPHELTLEAKRAFGVLLVIALPLSFTVFAVTWALNGHEAGPSTFAVALAAPVICLQDAFRFAAVAGNKAGLALASDALWAAVLLALLPLSASLTSDRVLWLWTAAAILALLVLMIGLHLVPDFGGLRHSWRQRHPTSESVTVGTVVTLAASLAVTAMVAAMLGDADVGSLRGASTVMGPLNVLMAFVTLGLTPWMVRKDRGKDLENCALIAVSTVAVAVLWAVLVLSLPASMGARLLGDSWEGTRDVLPYTSLEYVALMVSLAGMQGLKIRAEAVKLLWQRLIVAGAMVVVGLATAWVFRDVRAVAAGLAVCAALGAILAWVDLRVSARTGAGLGSYVRPVRR